MQKWQWNDAVAREMLMEVDNAANQCFQKYDFAKAEENNNDALLLLKQILQNINSFDPYLQNDEKRIRNNLQLAQTNRVKQQNQFTVNNKQQEEALMTKLREEIDTCSKIKLPSFNIMDTFLNKLFHFSSDQNSYKDAEFSNPNHLYYSKILMKRFPLSELKKMDPSTLKPSKLSKQLKKNLLCWLLLLLSSTKTRKQSKTYFIQEQLSLKSQSTTLMENTSSDSTSMEVTKVYLSMTF